MADMPSNMDEERKDKAVFVVGVISICFEKI